jgi:hypothetical protein
VSWIGWWAHTKARRHEGVSDGSIVQLSIFVVSCLRVRSSGELDWVAGGLTRRREGLSDGSIVQLLIFVASVRQLPDPEYSFRLPHLILTESKL